MTAGLRKADLQRIAETKFADAQLLLNNQRWSNAYYLAGYAIEIGIKAVIARRMAHETIPDLNFIRSIHQHGFKELIGVAGLTSDFQQTQADDPQFGAYSGIVAQWKPEVRYTSVDAISAQMMVQAVGDPGPGILGWIKTFW
jgi:hypothetical protein